MNERLTLTPGDALSSESLAGLLRIFGAAPVGGDGASDAELIDRIALLERVKSAVAAAQAGETAAFSARQFAGKSMSRAKREKVQRSVNGQVALARRESPFRGGMHVGASTILTKEMPCTFAALRTGEITEWQAIVMVKETATLTLADRRTVDSELGGKLGPLNDKQIAARAAAIGYRLDPHQAVERHRRAAKNSTLTVRPAPDGMCYLTGAVPLVKGVGVYALMDKFARAAKAAGDGRARGLIMVEELINRVTSPGLGAAPNSDAEVAWSQPENAASAAVLAPATGVVGPVAVVAVEAPATVIAEPAAPPVVVDSFEAPVIAEPIATPAIEPPVTVVVEASHSVVIEPDGTAAVEPAASPEAEVEAGVAAVVVAAVDVSAASTPGECSLPAASEPVAPVAPEPVDLPEPFVSDEPELDQLAELPAGINLDIQLVMTDRTLLDGDDEPAILTGYGPIPAPLARRIAANAIDQLRAFVRRLYTDPTTGRLTDMDTRRRQFPASVRDFIRTRDQNCRTAWCAAPIRHTDHAVAHAQGGRTHVYNADGVCENCNYTKTVTGWTTTTDPDGTLTTITPTGHRHITDPPPPPRSQPWAAEPDSPSPPPSQTPADAPCDSDDLCDDDWPQLPVANPVDNWADNWSMEVRLERLLNSQLLKAD